MREVGTAATYSGVIISIMRTYHVYILANRSRSLYVGVTGNLLQRLWRHRAGMVKWTSRYQIDRLVYAEYMVDVHAAIRREKQIKGWRRERKLALISAVNPGWDDLAPEVAPRRPD